MNPILVFGDSNAHGTPPIVTLPASGRHDRADRWPEVMAAALGREVISDALPGRTTVHDDPVEGGQRNGASVILSSLHAHKPLDLVIIALGTNDLKMRFSVSSWEISRSVMRLVEMTYREEVARDVMVMAPAPVREIGDLRDVFAGAEKRQHGLTGHLREICKAAGIGFFDAGEVVEVSSVDGVHLEIEAHHALGRAMAEAVRARLG